MTHSRIFAWLLAVGVFAPGWAGLCAETEGRFVIENLLGPTLGFEEPKAAAAATPSATGDVVVLPTRGEPAAFSLESPGPANRDPLFVSESLHPTGRSVVFGVADAGAADVVILDHGLNQGFRIGMVCRVTRGGQTIGEIILVEVRDDRAAGLITGLQPASTIQSGDNVRIQTL